MAGSFSCAGGLSPRSSFLAWIFLPDDESYGTGLTQPIRSALSAFNRRPFT